ncbi:hypothetical protein SBOR_5302 [Sclerotinia borealis F-4128]|uniref:Uncharacterized protein n=1 Tax=Sclerotinia borealis (strain F-4128) TaxID=1432307 RepID=W9CEP7_SCLBF|nr:hypothetical protein SBOR_5302 [Sclerotinia borealis F-4128]
MSNNLPVIFKQKSAPEKITHDPLNIPGNLIHDDIDFQATYAYILSLREAPAQALGAWEEKTLAPAPTSVQPDGPYEPIAVHLEESIMRGYFPQLTPSTRAANAIWEESNLPMTTINLAKTVYFRFRSLQPSESMDIAPPAIVQSGFDSPESAEYKSILDLYLEKMAIVILERSEQIASSMVLANIRSNEFRQRCRSNMGNLALAMFFYKTVTDDQIYYIYGPIWSAIDFSFIRVSDTLPENPTLKENLQWDLRKFTKLGFASFASHFFENCLQRKALRRHDSQQMSETEKKALASKLEDENDGIAEDRDASANPKTEDQGNILFDAEEARNNFDRGRLKVLWHWKKAPYAKFMVFPETLPATATFKTSVDFE